MVIVVQLRLAREIEVLGENLPQRHFVHHKSHMTRAVPPRWETGDKLPELRHRFARYRNFPAIRMSHLTHILSVPSNLTTDLAIYFEASI
jgi:hypothetical protein